jgi:hypothetical protein
VRAAKGDGRLRKLRDEFGAAGFEEVDQGWIHVAVVIGYVEDNDAFSAEVFSEFVVSLVRWLFSMTQIKSAH